MTDCGAIDRQLVVLTPNASVYGTVTTTGDQFGTVSWHSHRVRFGPAGARQDTRGIAGVSPHRQPLARRAARPAWVTRQTDDGLRVRAVAATGERQPQVLLFHQTRLGIMALIAVLPITSIVNLIGTRVSTSIIINMPPGKILFVVISRSLCECHI